MFVGLDLFLNFVFVCVCVVQVIFTDLWTAEYQLVASGTESAAILFLAH